MAKNIGAQSQSIIKKTNESLIFRLVFKLGQQLLALIFGTLLARILSPAEFGVVAVANLIIHYANNFTNFGLNNALVQNDNVQRGHINTVFTVDLAISSTLLVGTILAADRIAHFFHNPTVGPVLKCMAFYYVITTFYHIPVVILRRNIDFRFLTVIEFIEGILNPVLAIALALNGLSYWSIVIPSLAVPVFVTIVLMVRTRWIPKIDLVKNMGELYSFGFWNFVRAQVQMIVSKVDYFVIARYLGTQYLGLYEKSFELTDRAMSGLTMPVNTIFFSTFSRMKWNTNQLKEVFLEASSLLALICYPVLCGIIGVAPHFVMSCLGSKWHGAITPLQILACGSLFRVHLGLAASANVAIGRYKIQTLVNTGVAILFICSCLFAVQYGIAAISFAYFLFCLTGFIASFCVLRSSLGLGFGRIISHIWCPFLGSLLMLAVLVLMKQTVFNDLCSFAQLAELVLIGAVVYILWCYIFIGLGKISLSISGGTGEVK